MKHAPSIMKKTAAALLATSMLAGSAVGVASAKNDPKANNNKNKPDKKIEFKLDFRDVSEKDLKWAYSHIIRLAAQGVFNGYDDGSFKPQNKITRIEALVAAVRLLGLQSEAEKAENMNAKLNFKDFDKLKSKYGWAVGYVTVALENDLFSENDTSINPEQPANRLWASVLLVKALKLDGEAKKKMDAELPFKDAREIPAGSVGYIAVALEKNLITGYNDNTFQPNRPVTRAELAALLDRVNGQLPEDQSAQAITGTVQSVVNGIITVKRADNTSVAVTLDPNVFVFRNDVKSPASSIQAGDEVLVRTYQSKAVFIEVTKKAAENVAFVDAGSLVSYTLNGSKLSTITITRNLNGTSQNVTYNVDANVSITGGNGVLLTNMVVILKGENGIVKTLEIQN